MCSVPSEDILENLFDAQIRKCSHFHSTYSLYEMRTTHEGERKTYNKLRTMVLTHIALRQQNKITAQAQHPHNQSAAAAPGGARKRDCYKWMETGNCTAGDECPFAHDNAKRGSKKKDKGSARSPSRTAEVASARKDGVYTPALPCGTYRIPSPSGATFARRSRGKSPSGEKNKPICKSWIKGNCSYGDSCKLCHISVCSHWKKGECKAGQQCLFLHREATGIASPAPSRDETSVERRKREKNAAKRKASKERKKAAAAVAIDAETGSPLDQ